MPKLLLLICYFLPFIGFAQKIPSYGKIDIADLQATTCSFEKDAPAELIIDEGDTRFEWGSKSFFYMVTDRRKRIKILSQKGMSYADVKLRFLSDDRYERIRSITATTYNLVDNKIEATKMEKKLVYTQKINDEVSEISFSLPNVKVGSIIEYKYTTEKESFSNLAPWYFQKELPIRWSSYNLQIPEFFRFTASLLTTQAIDKKEENDNKGIAYNGSVLRMNVTNFLYTTKNMVSIKEEPFMTSIKDYAQRIEFQLAEIILPNDRYSYTTTWEQLAEELRKNELFGEQLKKNVSLPDLDILVEQATSTTNKIKIIYDYFKKNYAWNDINDYYCTNVKKIAEQKTGSSGDLNLLFLNLLKHYKIEAYPLLVSTKDNGAVNTFYPFLKQFNTVNAYIPINDSYYVINAADKYNSYNLIPYDAVNTNALKILKEDSRWVNLNNAKMTEKHLVSFKAEVTDSGQFVGTAYINSNGYAKPPRLEALSKSQANYTSKYYTHANTKINVLETIFTNEQIDSLGLEQKVKFNSNLISNGDYQLLYYNLFMGVGENPFTADTRNADIDFSYGKQYNLNAYFSFAASYDFEELPKNIKLIMPDTGIIFERNIFREDNIVTLSMSLKILKPVYYASEYPYLKDFYKALYEFLNEPIVLLKRKK
jgi:hypothetical protein